MPENVQGLSIRITSNKSADRQCKIILTKLLPCFDQKQLFTFVADIFIFARLAYTS